MDRVEKVKIHLFDLTLDAIQEYRETGKEETAYAIFALYEVTDKLGWLSELEEKAKEAGLDVRFS